MPFRTLPEIKGIIHGTEMKKVLKAVFYLAGATEKHQRGRIAKALSETLGRYENEDCWKDIIVYSPIAGDVCDVLEEGLI